MADRVPDFGKLDELELLCSAYICMDGDLPRLEAWFTQAKLPELAEKARLHYNLLQSRFAEVRKRVLERNALRALNDVVNDPRSRQRVAAAQALITVAQADTSTAEGRAMLQELMAGGKKGRASK